MAVTLRDTGAITPANHFDLADRRGTSAVSADSIYLLATSNLNDEDHKTPLSEFWESAPELLLVSNDILEPIAFQDPAWSEDGHRQSFLHNFLGYLQEI